MRWGERVRVEIDPRKLTRGDRIMAWMLGIRFGKGSK